MTTVELAFLIIVPLIASIIGWQFGTVLILRQKLADSTKEEE